ncbi:hypothetical protein [Bacillus sp. T33-2]|uniref:hypothetical protein n=1 Tax=Bacillus sp. T33-2 TaxID=2054168 RepID=UPI000C77D3D1|nr:hypothetical protein [Bacillus sp. T33-2]PLR89485.1 hypothetical protein CVD19_23685 [Bacillus sp. T33-2]
MDKRTIRAFAFGIFLAAGILGFKDHFSENPDKADVSVADAKEMLGEEGYEVISAAELASLKEKQTSQENKTVTDKTPLATEAQAGEAATPESEAEQKKIVLTVASGMTIQEIADILYREKLIGDTNGFERFLIDSGYHTQIQLGSFELTAGQTFEEIAKVITKN